MNFTNCTKCNADSIYNDGTLWICPICGHEWTETSHSQVTESKIDEAVKDAFGNILADGDTVTLVKELKIKGSSTAIKIGTKVKNIKVDDMGDGHNISCRIDGFGAMNLKSEFVKKC